MAFKKLSKEERRARKQAREEKQAKKVMNGIIGTLLVLLLIILCYFFAINYPNCPSIKYLHYPSKILYRGIMLFTKKREAIRLTAERQLNMRQTWQ